MATNTEMLFNYNPSEPKKDFRCGASMFSDNIWDFNGYVDKPHLKGGRLQVKFIPIEHKPNILEVAKWYIFLKLTINDISTAKRSLDGIIRFVKFIDEYYQEIDSFLDINQEVLKSYFEYLLYEAKSETNGKPLSKTSITKSALAIKDILLKGTVKGWNVPKDSSYVQPMYNELIINNKVLKAYAKKSKAEIELKVSNQAIIDLIIKKAVNDLEKGENVLAAAGILITSQIGLRISEINTLKSGCLQQIGGDTMIDCSTAKLHAERIEVLKPANDLVVLAITKLEEHSKPLREESGLNYLFMGRTRNIKGHPATLVDAVNWNKNYLRPWIKKHNIVDSEGNLVNMTSHTFRHAFATYALRGGASIEVISELMNHKTIRGTMHYTHLLQEDVKRNFSKVLNEGAVISGKKALQIKEKLKSNNPFKGKTVDQVDKLRKAMKIQVLSHGLCLHHPMRNEPCAGDGVCMGCNNFVTTPDYLKVHKERLANVQRELAKAPKEGPFESKLKHMEKYLIEIIDDLENQLNYKGKKDNAQYKIINS